MANRMAEHCGDAPHADQGCDRKGEDEDGVDLRGMEEVGRREFTWMVNLVIRHHPMDANAIPRQGQHTPAEDIEHPNTDGHWPRVCGFLREATDEALYHGAAPRLAVDRRIEDHYEEDHFSPKPHGAVASFAFADEIDSDPNEEAKLNDDEDEQEQRKARDRDREVQQEGLLNVLLHNP